MAIASPVECESVTIPLFRGQKTITLPRLLSSCWYDDSGKTAYVIANPDDETVKFKIENENYEISPLDAMIILR
jgi:hypothetical protein